MTYPAYTFAMQVSVIDPAALYAAAHARALADGITDIDEIIGTADEPAIEGCIQMLLDPGTPPAGLEIDWSAVDADPDLEAPSPEEELHALYQQQIDRDGR